MHKFSVLLLTNDIQCCVRMNSHLIDIYTDVGNLFSDID